VCLIRRQACTFPQSVTRDWYLECSMLGVAEKRSISERLRERLPEIVDAWETRVRDRWSDEEKQQPTFVIRDSLPEFLSELAAGFDRDPADLTEPCKRHGRERRMLMGYSLIRIIREYQFLSEILLEKLELDGALTMDERLMVLRDVWECLVDACSEFSRVHSALYAREASERMEAERRAAQLDATIASLPEAIYIGDARGISLSNQLALDMLGFRDKEEMDHNVQALSELIRNRDPETGKDLPWSEVPFSLALQGHANVRETLVRHLKTGENRVILSRAAPIRVEGRLIGAVAINSDITEQKRLELGLRAALRDLREERDLAERFTALVSHDLRSPLSAARVSADLLLRILKGSDTATPFIHRLIHSLQRADHLIENLLDVHRIRAGTPIPIQLEDLDLSELAHEAVEDLETIYGKRFEIRSAGPMHGHWSRRGLLRVIENLCQNAVKYGAPDLPVTIELGTGTKGDVTITVRNFGEPIPSEQIGALFDPFHRGRRQSIDQREGLGLGLTLVRGIVDAHGGRVEVSSSSSQGTAFTIVIPRIVRSGKAA
jgi:signal transduction histidine kinase